MVAEEVRTLAQSSHDSASSITSQVKEVTASMSEVVEQVRRVGRSSELSQTSVGDALRSVDHVVEAFK
ncbi:hypothetical protein [Vibrio mexicanus]|uniref:hypothetical protein n=1 Tax=Vibrio mexicanus TaxID=1004326 RepID=UPI00063CAB1C|nr:hypothetical protein [Vibrio mexicanus]